MPAKQMASAIKDRIRDTAIDNLPFVTVIMPCRDEGSFIGKCLDSVIANDYPKERLEILVIDGMSKDETNAIIRDYSNLYPFIKIIENKNRTTPHALNKGIQNAVGEIVLRMDCHSVYKKDYVSKCVNYLSKYNVDNVGGVIVTQPRESTLMGECIAIALSSRFGVGNSFFRVGAKKPMFVDTVFGGCYKRELFNKVGLFNEKLARSQDIELNLRIKKMGGKVLLIPDIVSHYIVHSDFASFVKHSFRNGLWAIVPFKYTDVIPVSKRHFAPLLFIVSLVGLAILSLFNSIFMWPLTATACSYMVANLFSSLHIAFKKKRPGYFLLMPIIFISLHMVYGLGSLWGLLRVALSKNFWA